jgi:hypothetical protein
MNASSVKFELVLESVAGLAKSTGVSVCYSAGYAG